MPWTIEYLSSARKQLRQLDPQVSNRIVRFMRERVGSLPSAFQIGHGLTGKWAGFWRYRVGDYRIVCVTFEDSLIVQVVKVGHRSNIYDKAPGAELLTLTGLNLRLVDKEDQS